MHITLAKVVETARATHSYMVMRNYFFTGNLKGTSHPHKSNISIDDDGKSDVRSSISNSTGMH